MKPKLQINPAMGAIFSGLLILVYVTLMAIDERAEFLKSASVQTQKFTRVLEEHSRQTLLRVGGDLSRADALLGHLQQEGNLNARQARAQLTNLLPADRLIESYLVLDRSGALVLSTQQGQGSMLLSGAEQDYFAPHIRGADRELVFGNPVKAVDGQWLLPVSRRLGEVGNAFEGVLVAMVRAGYFQTFYDSIESGQDSFITLFLSSGTSVVTSPPSDAVVGKNWSQSPLFSKHLPAWPNGTVRAVMFGDEGERIYSYRALNDYPVVVVYGLSMTSILGVWQQRLWHESLLVALALLLLAGIAFRLKRQEHWRQASANELAESEKRFRTLTEWSPEAILVHRLGKILYVNPAAVKLFGAHQAQVLLCKTTQDLVHPDFKADQAARLNSLVEGAAQLSPTDSRFVRLDGAVIDVKVQGTSVIYDGLPAIHVVIQDITEQNRALNELRSKETQLRAMFESAIDGILIFRPDGEVVSVNESFAKMHGYALEEMRSMTLKNIDTPETERGAVARRDAIIAGELSLFEVTHYHRDGHVISLEVSASQIVAEGSILIQCFHRDITERKQAAEAQRIAATAFESQQGMTITNAERVILRVNKAFSEITGYSAEEVIGQNPRVLSSGRHDRAFYAAMTQSLESQGGWQGEIWNRRKSGEIYPEWLTISAVKNDAQVTTHYVATFADISERMTAQAQIDTLAFYDPLTQLPNRRLFMDRLKLALFSSTRHQRKSALMLVDLDNFRTLNDTLGHQQGDLLLEQVSQRLTTCIREGDTLARLSSDEFVVMLEDLNEDELEAAQQAETVGDKILAVFSDDFLLDNGAHHSTCSIGVSLFGGNHQGSSEEPLKHAELAMFQAKAAGRNTLRFFDAQMQANVSALASLETDLREAVQQQQFLLHYQAQVVGGGRITGVEALVRWQHPLRGMVSPVQFIALAEESGLILPIGQWVLETACLQLAAWALRTEREHLSIAVNVSASQFAQTDFVDSVLGTLSRTQANPKRLKLELTESMLVTDVESTIAKMNQLKVKGVSFSLDDFGTGYSSLTYLKRLPLDQLKIDQGFVRNIVTDTNDAAIAKMVLALAESLGLSVIAEGVELQAQADFLAHLGCHAYQGYLFSRPLPIAAFEAFANLQNESG